MACLCALNATFSCQLLISCGFCILKDQVRCCFPFPLVTSVVNWSANDCNLKKHLWYHTVHLPGHSSDRLDITWTQENWWLLPFLGLSPYLCYMPVVPRWESVSRYIHNVHQSFPKASFSNVSPSPGVCRSTPTINQLMKVNIIYKYHTCKDWFSDYLQ